VLRTSSAEDAARDTPSVEDCDIDSVDLAARDDTVGWLTLAAPMTLLVKLDTALERVVETTAVPLFRTDATAAEAAAN
jgi:hypothetical protein